MDKTSSTGARLADHAAGQFDPHGDLDLWLDGRVLRSRVRGPLNREAVEALGRLRADLFARWPLDGAYAMLVVWEQSMLMSPEAIALYRASLDVYDRGAPKPCAVAWVIAPEIEGAGIMLPRFAAALAKAGMDFQAFATPEAAEAWVVERLAAA